MKPFLYRKLSELACGMFVAYLVAAFFYPQFVPQAVCSLLLAFFSLLAAQPPAHAPRSRRQRFHIPRTGDEPLQPGYNAPADASPFVGPALPGESDYHA